MHGEQHSWKGTGRGRFVRLLAALLSALLLRAAVFWQTRRAELASFRSQFETDAAQRTAFIRQAADKSLLTIKSLGWFFDAAGDVDAKSFQRFAAACLPDQSELQGLSWNPRV